MHSISRHDGRRHFITSDGEKERIRSPVNFQIVVLRVRAFTAPRVLPSDAKGFPASTTSPSVFHPGRVHATKAAALSRIGGRRNTFFHSAIKSVYSRERAVSFRVRQFLLRLYFASGYSVLNVRMSTWCPAIPSKRRETSFTTISI